jgi:hypothetical protein
MRGRVGKALGERAAMRGQARWAGWLWGELEVKGVRCQCFGTHAHPQIGEGPASLALSAIKNSRHARLQSSQAYPAPTESTPRPPDGLPLAAAPGGGGLRQQPQPLAARRHGVSQQAAAATLAAQLQRRPPWAARAAPAAAGDDVGRPPRHRAPPPRQLLAAAHRGGRRWVQRGGKRVLPEGQAAAVAATSHTTTTTAAAQPHPAPLPQTAAELALEEWGKKEAARCDSGDPDLELCELPGIISTPPVERPAAEEAWSRGRCACLGVGLRRGTCRARLFAVCTARAVLQ